MSEKENAKFKKGDLVFKRTMVEKGIFGEPMKILNVSKKKLKGSFYVRLSRRFWVFEEKLFSINEAIEILEFNSKNDIKLLLNQLKYQFRERKKVLKLKKAVSENISFDEIVKICKENI